MKKIKCNSVFVSDLHVGSIGCKLDILIDFLEHIDAKNIYLLGDIIDFWRSSFKWKKKESKVLRRLLKISEKSNVVYIPGNHDEVLRDFAGNKIGNVSIKLNHIYTSISGMKYMLLHGDEFDNVIRKNKWLGHLGAFLYEHLISLNNIINYFRRKLGLKYWSFATFLKSKSKNVVKVISNFENSIIDLVKLQKLDGVICGHVHTLEIKYIDGYRYINTGDFVENCSAVIEDESGMFKQVVYREGEWEIL